MPSKLNAITTGTPRLKFVAEADGGLEIQNDGNTAISITSSGQASFAHDISQPGAFMFRNKIINGNFDVWQRATSQTLNGYGSADRWASFNTGSTKTASRQSFALGQTDVPGNPKYFMRHVVSSVAGSGNNALLSHRIEGVETLSGKTVTLSFWAKADANKNIAIEFFQRFGTTGSPSSDVGSIGSQLISLTTSWIKYTVTVNIPSISGKTLGTDSTDFLQVSFWFDAGSNWNSRTASLGQQSGTFDIAQVQVEEGSVATPFEQRHIGTEMSLCQRYYQYVYAGATVGTSYTTNIAYMKAFLSPIMRASPTVTLDGTSTISVNFFGIGSSTSSSITFGITPIHISLNVGSLSPSRTASVPVESLTPIIASAEL